jgi:hypothetical protein
VYDVDGALAGGETLLDARVALTLVPSDAPKTAVTLLDLQDRGNRDLQKIGYRLALDRKWLELGMPFALERQPKGWCFAARQPCPATAVHERDFTTALGRSVELLSPLPETTAALDGKPSDGKLALELPLLLLQRLGLSRTKSVRAAQTNIGFPAAFEAKLHAEKTTLVDAEVGVGKAPRNHVRDITLTALFDARCRLSRYAVAQDARTTIAPGTNSASRVVHTRQYDVSFSD